jgi:DNA uptake protein ComE-like DNA-binding protein
MPIDLNAASLEELIRRLPGIGVSRAKAIIAARPFKTPEELLTRAVLTERIYTKIARFLTVKRSFSRTGLSTSH